MLVSMDVDGVDVSGCSWMLDDTYRKSSHAFSERFEFFSTTASNNLSECCVISFLTANEAWIIEMRRAKRKQVP